MQQDQINNPLHGMRLDAIIEFLLGYYDGWETLGRKIPIKCFNENPSMKSSLTFLRKTPWARLKVEELFVEIMTKKSAR